VFDMMFGDGRNWGAFRMMHNFLKECGRKNMLNDLIRKTDKIDKADRSPGIGHLCCAEAHSNH